MTEARKTLKIHSSTLKNKNQNITDVTLAISQELLGLIELVDELMVMQPGETRESSIIISIPEDYPPNIVSGFIYFTTKNGIGKIPVDLRISENTQIKPTFTIQPLLNSIVPGNDLKLQVSIEFPQNNNKTVDATYTLFESTSEQIISSINKTYKVEGQQTDIVNIKLPSNANIGDYFVDATFTYKLFNKTFVTTKLSAITAKTPFLKTLNNLMYKQFWFFRVYQLFYLVLLVLVVLFGVKKYHEHLKRTQKFNIKVDKSTLPIPNNRTAFIGNLAETKLRTFYELDKLTTHALIAGTTGGGKTIAAQVMVEEALSKGIAVVVFDPTAQWTGFLRKNEDKKMFSNYEKFSLKKSDAKSYNGNIRLITNARTKIDLKKIISPGEINIFALNKLNSADMDIFVANTVRQIFIDNFEESSDLKILLVYDEVHRLLPKFGGNGIGFLQIERACREFRKWGIGILLVSQVLSDFVGQIKTNINTEIQMKTRDEGDLDRIKIKYGEEFLHSVITATTGIGMIQNSSYNKGQPYLVNFRPLFHNLSRLSDTDLDNYDKYNELIDNFRYEIDELKMNNVDVFDLELELKLGLDKLKKGEFRIVDIYTGTLKHKLENAWKSINKNPTKRVINLISQEEIDKDIELARKEDQKIKTKLNPSSNSGKTIEDETESKTESKIGSEIEPETELETESKTEPKIIVKKDVVKDKEDIPLEEVQIKSKPASKIIKIKNKKTSLIGLEERFNELSGIISSDKSLRKYQLRLTAIKGDLSVAKIKKRDKVLLKKINQELIKIENKL